MRMILLTVALLLPSTFARADAFVIDAEESVFAIATQRAGIAGQMGHDHFVYAGEYAYDLTVNAEDAAGIAFSLRVQSEALVIDDADALARWWPRLLEEGLVKRAASTFTDKERADVRAAMLGVDQLDAKNHPEIRAQVISIVPKEGDDKARHTHSMRVALTVVGETVEVNFKAKLALDGDELTVEAHGPARFTAFGIQPYSAFLGAVRNQDQFVVFVRVVARRQ